MTIWEALQALANMALPVLLGGGAVYIVREIKRLTGLDGNWSYLILALVSLALAAVSLAATGTFNDKSFSPTSIWLTLVTLIGASQIHYNRLKRDEAEADS